MHGTPLLRGATLLLFTALIVGCGGAQTTTPAPTAPSSETASPGLVAATAPAAAAPAAAATPIGSPPAASAQPLAAGWWDNAVCYEVFVRSFFDSNGDGVGDINGLISKLDYINDGNPEAQQDLGANCIWLMPVAESDTYHGYHVTDFYTVERDYGTNEDFKRLVAEAHKRGIRIILDLVLNHAAREHPWFQAALRDPGSPYRDWFVWSPTDPGYKGPWGQPVWHKSPVRDEYYYGIFNNQIPDLNYGNPAVTAEAYKISSFWRNEMGADGFRLDAIKHLIENGQVQENTPDTHAWLRGYRAFLEQAVPGTFTVGEIFDATPAILAPYYPDQLDSYFVFDIGQRIITAANQGNGKPFASAAQRVNDALPFQRYAPFLTNHDQNRSMGLLGNDVAKAKLAATALLTLPGMPYVYYGEEIGMVGAKGSPPKVDEPLRTPMQWTGDAQGGFTAGQAWQALQDNVALTNVAVQTDDASSLLNHYRKLIHLHTSNPALAVGSLTSLRASENDLAAYVRQADNNAVLVVLNFGRKAVQSGALSIESSALPAGTYQLEPLLGDQPGAPMQVASAGSITNYTPLPTLEAQTGYVFKLRR